jgi:hypothetical protein
MRPAFLALGLALCLVTAAPGSALARTPEAPAQWGPYSVELVDEQGAVLPTYPFGGRTYALGALGQRYLVRVRNGSWRRAEVVVSVDGRDVVDGRTAGLEKRGYIVEPRSEVTIDGYRLDQSSVAAFRFSSVQRSYAARRGDARDVGVIGVAVFPERPPRRVAPPPYPHPSPYPNRDRAGRTYDDAPEPRSEAAPAGQADAFRAEGPSPGASSSAPQRPGLGTEFGEEHGSPVVDVPFERESAQPQVVLTLRYDDREALLAMGIDVDRRRAGADEAWLRRTAEPFRPRSGPYAEPPPGWSR